MSDVLGNSIGNMGEGSKNAKQMKLINNGKDPKEIDPRNKLNELTNIEKTNFEKYFQMGLAENNPSGVKINEELSIGFFKGKCTNIAKSLLGKLLINKTPEGIAGGIIVETEAYLGKNDPACHLSNGLTKRNGPFFEGSGTIYIFKIHRYNNLNVISEYNSHPECILIRAIEPTYGLKLMKKRRGTDELMDLTTGPGRLTEALGIIKEKSNNKKINTGTIFIFNTSLTNFDTASTTRIGISKATDWPLRYCIKNNPFVSRKAKKEKTFVSFNE
jgi:DNA-3-methyladenine glycosylase